ncbi:hypothetical protein ScPMuIL_018996 [Solemya velum]
MARPSSAATLPKLKDFVFIEKLGSGSYATVYKAYRKGGPREVIAIKCVLKSSLTKTSTENLLTEIELLKKLKHENIVELKDFQWDDTYIYLIMEYCKGGDLSHFLRSRKALPEKIVKRFLQQMTNAMVFLRDHNVVHMDLKPQNILLTSATTPVLKLADFGFAKHVFHGDELNALRGSPLYMAPEIICKGHYDARVDLWSIGVILYECLFGRAPFASRSFKELEKRIRDSKPVELPYGATVSDDCRDLLQKLLRRNPDDRMSFDDFFDHPFVDIEHAPAARCLSKASLLVSAAVDDDSKGDYKSAVELYCEALEYFVPAIHYEQDEAKKNVLRKKVKEYMNRAEELKEILKPNPTLHRSTSNDPHEVLMELFHDNEEMQAALKVVKAAQTEIDQEDFDAALHHYELGLEVLIKTIQGEPKGKRKDLIRQQIEKAMSKAEEVKNYLSVKTLLTNETSKEDEETDSSFINDQTQCVIQ